jgi:hypothetical protein
MSLQVMPAPCRSACCVLPGDLACVLPVDIARSRPTWCSSLRLWTGWSGGSGEAPGGEGGGCLGEPGSTQQL